ncbi:Ig-like domain-containing protein [Leptonema illini]|uniref:Ig-like domain-containing protein n=1 Tax=Leptonema illini TaxID=183 RepID=UPI00031B4A8D
MFSDGTTSNITDQVNWSSDDADIVTVANGAGFEGRATAVATGSTTITAEIGGIDASITFTVTPAVLSSIQVHLDDSSIAKGTSTTATATGVYTDDPRRISEIRFPGRLRCLLAYRSER